MLFYFLVISITTFIAWCYSRADAREKKIIFAIMVLFPGIIAGLRGVGTDYCMYREHYQEIIQNKYELVDNHSLLVQFFRFVGRIGGNIQIAFILVSVLTVFIAFYTIVLCEPHVNVTFAVFSFMTTFYLMSFNLFRQLLAAELFLLASIYLFAYKNKRKCLVFSILAVSIHSSIFPFLLIFPFKKIIIEKKYRKLRIGMYIAIATVIMMLPLFADVLGALSNYISHYAWFLTRFSYTPIGVGAIRYVILAIIPIFFVLSRRNTNDPDNIYVSYLPFYGIAGTILWFSSYVTSATLYRMSYILLISLPIMHGYVFKKIINKRNSFLVVGVCALLILLCIYDFGILNSGEIVPYCFYWQK